MVSLSIPDRVVVFDYGEVLSMSPSEHDRAAIVAVAESTDDVFWPVYWAHRDDLDHGVVTVAEYWARVGADLGREYSPSHVQRLWAVDFRSWISVEPGAIDILDDLQAGGTRLALLSNAGFDFGDPFRRSPMGRYFERVFVSAEVGLIKPDPEIYRLVARELGVEPADLVFVDNKPENVAGAESIGVTGHVFTGVADLRTFLTALASGVSA